MDNESALDMNQAAEVFSGMFDTAEEKDPLVDTEVDTPVKPDKASDETLDDAEPTAKPNAADEGGDLTTVTIDGKEVQLTKAQIADAVKGSMRQADYSKKTGEAAETRRAADAEIAKAHQERAQYASNLEKMSAQLEGAINEQHKIDFDALLQSDPVEYLKQRDLLEKRQRAYQANERQRQEVAAQTEAENKAAYRTYVDTQQQELLAKLPTWKDETKAKAEKEALKAYLQKEGYDDAAISGVSDHKAVILARKAMLYDQMIAKAGAAAKKVAGLPQKVERPGVADSPNVDNRRAAMARVGKTGRIEDAAAAFATFI
mgnify:CR=1 FL=1